MTELVGIVNITPDSFSDGGKALAPEAALTQIATLIKEGAAVIDLGAESTRPNAVPLSPEEEWNRLEPVVQPALQAWHGKNVRFSIDTRHAAVAAKALAQGAHWINDVSGGEDPEMWQLMRQYRQARYVLTHSLTVPADAGVTLAPAEDVMEALLLFYAGKLVEMQLEEHQVILDPGIGFGKTAAQSLQILRRMGELRVFNLPLLVGHSRKSCFGGTVGDRDGATLAASLHLVQKGVDYLRVHAIGLHRSALEAAEILA